MALAEATSQRRGSRPLTIWPTVVGGCLLAALVGWWSWRALHDPVTYDTGLAYKGGQVAWATGHPEHVLTWISTPFLGATMAIVTRMGSITQASHLVTILNIACVVGCVGVVLWRLRPILSPLWWWIAALALVTYAPMMSSVWWKQFNVFAIVLAVGGFALIRTGRGHRGGALIGLSIAIKPLALLLPVALLLRRQTRRAGALAILYFVGLNVAAQAFLAWRARSVAALNVLPVLKDYAHRSEPANLWACVPENFAPGSLLCRLWSGSDWTLEHVLIYAFVALLAAWIFDALRGRSAVSWEVFCFTCAISTMVSPIAWSHYQIMLAPLFLLLLVRFTTEGASVGTWAGLAVAFALTALMWQPYGSLVGVVHGLVTGRPETTPQLVRVEGVAEFAQYILIVTGVMWYLRRQQPRPALVSREGGLE